MGLSNDELLAKSRGTTDMERPPTRVTPRTERQRRRELMRKAASVQTDTLALRPKPRPKRAAAPAPIVLQPQIYVQTPTQKAAPPVVNVRVDATPKATRTRVIKTDEDGIATETITEPVE